MERLDTVVELLQGQGLEITEMKSNSDCDRYMQKSIVDYDKNTSDANIILMSGLKVF